MDPSGAPECPFCGIAIRTGDDLDSAGTAHAACVAAKHHDRVEDGERWRRLRQLWKFAKS